jgi:hypothetical protein
MLRGCSDLRALVLRSFSMFALLLSIAALPVTALAQQTPSSPTLLQNPSNGGNLTQFFWSARTPFEFWLTCIIGILALVIIGVLVVALRGIKDPRPEDIARPVIVITVIMSTLMLVTVGYSNEQIAPAFGLFGTIVGYMLGRISQPPSSNDPTRGPTSDTHQPPSQ